MPSQEEVIQFSALKVNTENLEVIFENGILLKKEPPVQYGAVLEGLKEVSKSIEQNNAHLHILSDRIDHLTNHTDGLNYMVAAGSGILAGFIDVFWEIQIEKLCWTLGKS